jgi:hypothetical protein
MTRYTVKISDSSGLSANVLYVREDASHKVEYYRNHRLVGEDYFNTEIEATKSASHFIDNGELHGNHF